MSKTGLLDKTAIVTGASSGIGRATALALARHGAHVALAARNEPRLDEVATAIRALGRQALVVPTDVAEPAQVSHLVSETVARLGHADIFVANAGQYLRRRVSEVSIADLERAMAVNFYGAIHGVLAVLPHMVARRSGHIVFMSSLDAKKGVPIDAPYVSAKSALSGFADVMRQELRNSGVHVTAVFPGRIDTPMLEGLEVPWCSPKLPPEAVARAVVRGIRCHRPEVIVPGYYRSLLVLNAAFPRVVDWLVRTLHLEGRAVARP